MFAHIRVHQGKGVKYAEENVVLLAVEDVMSSQGLSPSPVAYMGALMASLQGSPPPQLAGATLNLLSITLPRLPAADSHRES